MSRSASSTGQITDYDVLEALLGLWKIHYPQQTFSVVSFSEAVKHIASALPKQFSQWASDISSQANLGIFLNFLEPRVSIVHRNKPEACIRVVGLEEEYLEFPDRGLIDQLWPAFQKALLVEPKPQAEPAVA